MRPFPVFALLFLVLPFIEIWLLIKVGSAIGALPTILLLILAGMLGIFLLRHQGFATLARVQRSVNEGQLPAQTMLEGVVLLVGGLLFIIPGFFTDILGLLCVLPPTRYLLLKLLLKRAVVSTSGFHRQTSSSQGSRYIEGEVVRRKDDDQFLP
ncbi:MAG: FxsA family protein [Gammaproteobacteria bacterium]|nr:FxsA family protein [Gammaproteobacteria bacterium]MBU1724385.1 FxsA family protein [Gammaproteobacteria bacterium]MBU2004311.1 FxsA family protein [Gammaproteobacteria bacterium]